MSTFATSSPQVSQPQFVALRLIGTGCVIFGVFLSGFFVAEPARYEPWMTMLTCLLFALDRRISPSVAPLRYLGKAPPKAIGLTILAPGIGLPVLATKFGEDEHRQNRRMRGEIAT